MAYDGEKPLGIKAYGSIPHILGSRLGPGDHSVPEAMSLICTDKAPPNYQVTITAKIDGCCVSAAKLNDGRIVALGRAGYLASSSNYEHIQLWGDWVDSNLKRFDALLEPGQRAVGEWIAKVHSTFYNPVVEPFFLFDIMQGHFRMPWYDMVSRNYRIEDQHNLAAFLMPDYASGPGSPNGAMDALYHAEANEPEGVVYRVESDVVKHGKPIHRTNFLAKWVHGGKTDGKYLKNDVWNWHPYKEPYIDHDEIDIGP